ncbi:MAG TPA: hypothetical protein VK395_23635 [Gemmataceae bacterium]|nr:hypothetical protein [Gemmataceae bacterium]
MTALISFAAGMVFVLVLIQARDFRAKTVTQPSPAAPPAVEEMAENAGLKDEKPDLVTPANMLWRFYENAVIGDTQYKGKLIQTYQAANGIEGDGHGGYVLCLQTMQVGLAPGRLEYGVVCHIDANDKAEFTKVAKGFDVTVIGRCVGRKEDRTKFGGYVVVLEHCRYSPEQLHLESAPRR